MLSLDTEKDDSRSVAVLLLVLSSQPRIADRTQIMKLTYIVDECEWGAIKDFRLIARGPYSEWIDNKIDSFIDGGLLEEAEESILIDTDNEIGFYCYSLTLQGRSLAKNTIDSIAEPEKVCKSSRLLTKLSYATEQDLEMMSSILYVSQERDLDREDIVKRIMGFKAEFPERLIRKHLNILEYKHIPT